MLRPSRGGWGRRARPLPNPAPHPGNDKGYWSGVTDLAQCAERCRGCANCRYVSFSWAHDECAWFTRCRLPLEQKFQGDTYQTLKVVSSKYVVVVVSK